MFKRLLKSTYILVILLPLLTSCMQMLRNEIKYLSGHNSITVLHDEFKNTKSITLRSILFPDETMKDSDFSDRPHDGISYGKLIFTKEINSENKEKIYLKIYAIATEDADKMRSQAFLKVDNKKIKVNLLNLASEIKSETTTGLSLNESDVSVSTYRWKNFKATMIIDDSLKKEVLSSSSFLIRLYSGIHPATFTFGKRDLKKIKVLLNHDGSKPKKKKKTGNSYKPY